jgi:nicotinamidase/pyrazinamidase
MKLFCDVDTQRDFMNSNGSLYVYGSEKIKSTISKINKLAHSDPSITLIKTMDSHDGSEPEMLSNGGLFPLHCVSGLEGQLSIEETDSDKAIIFTKKCYDVFDPKLGNQDIIQWLKDHPFNEVWVYGVATDYCVLAAVKGLVKYIPNVYVFENAIAGVDEKTTKDAIAEMKSIGAMFVKASL